MPDPSNTYTVTVADAHTHSVQQAGIPGSSKLDAALSALQAAQDEPTAFSELTTADTRTITVTQP
jgi:hypothetical protein